MRGDEPSVPSLKNNQERMYPTCVGMNRGYALRRAYKSHVPHMRGDEPEEKTLSDIADEMYPTCVGMNRGLTQLKALLNYVPHMRGDEPLAALFLILCLTCTPHAWG